MAEAQEDDTDEIPQGIESEDAKRRRISDDVRRMRENEGPGWSDPEHATPENFSKIVLGGLPGVGIAGAAGYTPKYDSKDDFIPSGFEKGPDIIDKIKKPDKGAMDYVDIGLTGLGVLPDAGYLAASAKGIKPAMKAAATGKYEGAPGERGAVNPKDKDSPLNDPKFAKFFRNSKVVDDDGNPVVVYKGMYPYDWTKESGTDQGPLISQIERTTEFPTFDSYDKKGLKIGGFFGDKETANKFAASVNGAVYPVYLNISKPYVVDADGKLAGTIQFGASGKEFRDAMRSGKYDGAIIKNTKDEGTIYVTLRSEQVKSKFNEGTWNPEEKDMGKALGGAVKRAQGGAVNPFDDLDDEPAIIEAPPVPGTEPHPFDNDDTHKPAAANEFDALDDAPAEPEAPPDEGPQPKYVPATDPRAVRTDDKGAPLVPVDEQYQNRDYNVTQNPDEAAPRSAIARASLAPDPEVRMQRYAEHFKQPIEDFKMIGDRLVRKIPGTKRWGYVERPGSALDWGAEQVGPSIPGATGVLGATAAGIPAALTRSPKTMVAVQSVAGGASAAGGEYLRQGLDRWLASDAKTPTDWNNVAWHTAAGLADAPAGIVVKKAAQGLTKLAAKVPGVRALVARAGPAAALVRQEGQNLLGLTNEAREAVLEYLDGKWGDIAQLAQEARDWGIDLSLGQKTGSRTLMNLERQAARYPEGTERFHALREKQNETQIPGMVRSQVLDKIAPAAAPESYVARFRGAADEVVAAEEKKRMELAQPLYTEAFAANKDMASPTLNRLLLTPHGKKAMTWARERMQNRMSRMGTPDPELTEQMRELVARGEMDPIKGGVSKGMKLETYDLIKQAMFDEEQALRKLVATGKARKGELKDLVDIRKDFIRELDRLDVTASTGKNSVRPDGGAYSRARKTFSDGSEDLEAMLEGGVGLLKRMKGADRQNMVTRVFSGTNLMPDEVAKMRGHFLRANKIGEWNAGIRSYVEAQLLKAMDPTQIAEASNVAGKLNKGLFGENAETLRAAIGDPALLDRWDRMGRLLKAVAHQLPEGSPTHTDAIADRGRMSKAFKAIGKVFSPDKWGDAIAEGVDAMNDPASRKKLVDYLLTDEGDRALRSLPGRITINNPPSRAMPVLGGIFLAAGIGGTARNKEDPE